MDTKKQAPTYDFHLGCFIGISDYESVCSPPSFTQKWKENYRLTPMSFPKPRTGTTKHKFGCPFCFKNVTIRVHSATRVLLKRFSALFIGASLPFLMYGLVLVIHKIPLSDDLRGLLAIGLLALLVFVAFPIFIGAFLFAFQKTITFAVTVKGCFQINNNGGPSEAHLVIANH